MSVWMVHAETGQYSDWDYNVCGVFSSYEAARKYVMGQSASVDEHPMEVDGTHFRLREEDWFITEYELDKGAMVRRTGFGYLSVGFEEGDG